MTVEPFLAEPGRVDEPKGAKDFSEVLSRVAEERRPVIVSRDGADLAALIPVEYLEVLREALARQEAERVAAGIDWERTAASSPPNQAWFDGDEPKPF